MLDKGKLFVRLSVMGRPRVTEVLRIAGLASGPLDEVALQRGTTVHLICRYHDEGRLDPGTVDPALVGYLDAWRLFWSRMPRPTWISIEREYDNLAYRGTPDRVCQLDGAYYILDLKTGHPAPWHAIQLAAYASLVGGLSSGIEFRRVAVYLQPDGQYQIKEYPQAEYSADLQVFHSALIIAEWKRRLSNGNKAFRSPSPDPE